LLTLNAGERISRIDTIYLSNKVTVPGSTNTETWLRQISF
jgi:hypothetical protein